MGNIPRKYIIWGAVGLVVLVIIVVVVLVLVSRGSGVEVRVRRVDASVWAGAGTSPPLLNDSSWHTLNDGDRVQTDASGQATLDFAGCMLIYLFQDGTNMVKSACPRSDRSGGSVTCAFEGTSTYNNKCASQVVIQTQSAEIELEGTWLAVTYLPENQLSLVIVSEGQAQVQPVLDFERRTLGQAVPVKAEYFWFTVPDTMLNQVTAITGLRPREVYPFDRLPNLIDTVGISTAGMLPWMEQIRERALQDGVTVPPEEPPQEEGAILVGMHLPASGEYAYMGQRMLQAVDLLVDQVNEVGGLLGRKVELLVEDDGDDPERAKEVAEKMVGSGVIAVIGASGPDTVEAASEEYARSDVLYIACSHDTDAFNESAYPGYFRVSFPRSQQSLVASRFIADILKAQRVAVLLEDSPQSLEMIESALSYMEEMGLDIVLYETIPAGLVDSRSSLSRLFEAEPEVVYFVGSSDQGGQYVRAAWERQMEVIWVMAGTCCDLAEFTGLRGPEVYVVSGPRPQDSQDPTVRAFLNASESRYGEPLDNVEWLMAAEAFNVIAQAIEETQSTDPMVLAEFLHQFGDVSGLTGPIEGWDRVGNRLGDFYAVYMLRDESLVPAPLQPR